MNAINPLKQIRHVLAQFVPFVHDSSNFLKLPQAHRSNELRHAVVWSMKQICSRPPALPRETLIGKQFHPLVVSLVCCDSHAAVARGHVFGLLKAKATDISDGACKFPLVLRE